MKTINRIKLFVFISSMSFGLMAQAPIKDTIQRDIRQNLNESVIISTQFDPVVNEAMKISDNPSIFDTSFAIPDLKYEIMNNVFSTKYNVEEIKAAKVKGEPISMLYNGNIKAGMGTYLTPYFEGLYSETRNKSLLYAIHARHYSSHWSIKDYAKNHFADNDINIYGKKIWNKFFVDAKAYYNNSINYYYGFNNDSIKLDNSDFRTSWHNVGFKANYESLFRNEDALNHKLSFGIEDLFGKWGSNELTVKLDAEASKRFELFDKDKQLLGLELSYLHSLSNFDVSILNAAPYFSKDVIPLLFFTNPTQTYNTGLVSIRPYFDFKVNKFQLHTAVDFVTEFGQEKDFYIYPTAIIYFPLMPKKIYFEGGLTGNLERISLNTIRIDNPYISPFLSIKTTSNYKLFAKLSSTFSNKLGINLEAGLQNFSNLHFYELEPFAEYNNMFTIVYDDAVRYYLKAHLEYNIIKVFSLNLDAEFQSYKMDLLDFAYYKPTFTTSLSLQYIVANKLIFDLIPQFKSGMKAMYLGEEKKLDPIIDINLSINYKYSDQLSLFVKLNNLAFQRYQEYYNFPSQKFMGMIGASFSF
ncbi:MAG TPA: hypothetical protein GX005_00135 [Bacteroidales bacterium]|nr:hypothetical protein [Bacteroidales bacterium]